MPKRPSTQVSFRIDKDLAKLIDDATAFEQLSRADFARKIFKRAFEDYQTAGSLHALRASDGEKTTPASKKKAS